jgi:hemerythrin
MGIGWSPKLAVGVDVIDEQHRELWGMKAQLVKGGSYPLLAVQLNNKLCDWLIDHIGRTDRALGAFLAKKVVRPVAAP